MTNDQLNIAELQKLAEAATPGPWKFSRESWNVATPDCDTDICVYQPEEDTDMTGEFIAAANPQAILSLVERIKELERSLAEYVTKRDVAVSTLDIVKEQRTIAQPQQLTDEDVNRLAAEAGAVAYSPPPLRAVRGFSFTYEQLRSFARALLAAGKENK